MATIALIGNKGGAGKTTLCVNLATALAQDQPTVIVDADPQQSSLQWSEIAGDGKAVEVVDAGADIPTTVPALAQRYRYRVIDCPPSAQSPQMLQALRVADLAVVPILPSPLDIWATVHVEDAIAIARETNPALAVLLVVNQFESRTRLSQLMQRALAELPFPVADGVIRRRAIYRHSLLEGRSVHDAGAKGKAAADEITQLVKEIRSYL